MVPRELSEVVDEPSVSGGGRPPYEVGGGPRGDRLERDDRSVCEVWSEMEPGPRRPCSVQQTAG